MLKIRQYKNTHLFPSLVEARIYLGFNNKSRNSKITQYLLGVRNGFCIFQLDKTLTCLRKATTIMSKINFSKKKILFVGLPESEKHLLIPLFLSTNHFYTCDQFWFNGTLTNGRHFNICVNAFKEIIKLKKRSEQLSFFKKFGGTYFLKRTPDLIVIFDHSESFQALREASKMGVPIVSFVNSSSNPEQCDYPIPGNFTSRLAGEFYYEVVKSFLENK